MPKHATYAAPAIGWPSGTESWAEPALRPVPRPRKPARRRILVAPASAAPRMPWQLAFIPVAIGAAILGACLAQLF